MYQLRVEIAAIEFADSNQQSIYCPSSKKTNGQSGLSVELRLEKRRTAVSCTRVPHKFFIRSAPAEDRLSVFLSLDRGLSFLSRAEAETPQEKQTFSLVACTEKPLEIGGAFFRNVGCCWLPLLACRTSSHSNGVSALEAPFGRVQVVWKVERENTTALTHASLDFECSMPVSSPLGKNVPSSAPLTNALRPLVDVHGNEWRPLGSDNAKQAASTGIQPNKSCTFVFQDSLTLSHESINPVSGQPLELPPMVHDESEKINAMPVFLGDHALPLEVPTSDAPCNTLSDDKSEPDCETNDAQREANLRYLKYFSQPTATLDPSAEVRSFKNGTSLIEEGRYSWLYATPCPLIVEQQRELAMEKPELPPVTALDYYAWLMTKGDIGDEKKESVDDVPFRKSALYCSLKEHIMEKIKA